MALPERGRADARNAARVLPTGCASENLRSSRTGLSGPRRPGSAIARLVTTPPAARTKFRPGPSREIPCRIRIAPRAPISRRSVGPRGLRGRTQMRTSHASGAWQNGCATLLRQRSGARAPRRSSKRHVGQACAPISTDYVCSGFGRIGPTLAVPNTNSCGAVLGWPCVGRWPTFRQILAQLSAEFGQQWPWVCQFGDELGRIGAELGQHSSDLARGPFEVLAEHGRSWLQSLTTLEASAHAFALMLPGPPRPRKSDVLRISGYCPKPGISGIPEEYLFRAGSARECDCEADRASLRPKPGKEAPFRNDVCRRRPFSSVGSMGSSAQAHQLSARWSRPPP